ncbi:MAG TPA: phosphopentomutase [Candidatus Avacidaminococcus intestinavium]|uniref:Phosphopentomutase n=1 Tax=Candidatus Avacidaminococcus intestinavium TaxID=2840684 RepID=A0A9D1SMA5_9FIRM|nr:phosphopentomutase [Candidatus Avacidaminococcus intestinavium]
MKKIIILLLDSFGVGAAKDAAVFGDAGADTLGHITEWCMTNRKTGPLYLPELDRLGLSRVAQASRGGIQLKHALSEYQGAPLGAYTYAAPQSKGKDTLSGHWELMGVPVEFDWGYFSQAEDSFPKELVSELIKKGQLSGVLGNKQASGTEIIKELGEEHCHTKKPIIYTSADSVLQIAAHEEYFGLERLYELCKIAFELVQPYRIARVIARPFTGESKTGFVRTANRHDYAVPAPEETLLDKLVAKHKDVFAVGKIADIFAHRGITKHYKAAGISELFQATLKAMVECQKDTLIFTNFVDFDSSFGHRRDPGGYANALEELDKLLPKLYEAMTVEDLLLITADHGCDPLWQGSDHTRENIPILFYGEKVKPQALKPMASFADVGSTLGKIFNITMPKGCAQDIFKKE